MKETIRQQKIPIRDNSAGDALIAFDPNLEKPIENLKTLPEEMQDNIFAYILHKRNEGMPKEKVAELLEFLVSKTFEMLNLSADQSDAKPKPVPSNLEPELRKQLEEVVAENIKSAEDTVRRNNFKPIGPDKYKH